jgi:AcrR family transcriptional regulator
MAKRLVLKPRKEPQQARSLQMREDILTAALRVLKREGALRFTTPRVAEAAGISVGSLYQYYPNKQALVFALHSRVVEQSWLEVERILDNPRASARLKIRRIARMFFLQETSDVSDYGPALQQAEIYFADQPEYRTMNRKILERFTLFLRRAQPKTATGQATFGARLLVTMLDSVGRAVAAMQLPRAEVNRWAQACADMIADHLGLP